uniref:Uncharacterized protein n=1 Tax=Humicola insolens TaxID=85995 RepID=A0A346DKQ0_HUMIN
MARADYIPQTRSVLISPSALRRDLPHEQSGEKTGETGSVSLKVDAKLKLSMWRAYNLISKYVVHIVEKGESVFLVKFLEEQAEVEYQKGTDHVAEARRRLQLWSTNGVESITRAVVAAPPGFVPKDSGAASIDQEIVAANRALRNTPASDATLQQYLPNRQFSLLDFQKTPASAQQPSTTPAASALPPSTSAQSMTTPATLPPPAAANKPAQLPALHPGRPEGELSEEEKAVIDNAVHMFNTHRIAMPDPTIGVLLSAAKDHTTKLTMKGHRKRLCMLALDGMIDIIRNAFQSEWTTNDTMFAETTCSLASLEIGRITESLEAAARRRKMFVVKDGVYVSNFTAQPAPSSLPTQTQDPTKAQTSKTEKSRPKLVTSSLTSVTKQASPQQKRIDWADDDGDLEEAFGNLGLGDIAKNNPYECLKCDVEDD